MLSISFLEGEGFHELTAFVELEYKLPSQRISQLHLTLVLRYVLMEVIEYGD